VGIYDLATGRALHYADLTSLTPNGDHLINGITLDPNGNAYVTDSFAPIIYKVDPSGAPSIFLKHHEFEGDGIKLNGIVYHPDGFLLVVKKNTGVLYRIPVADPQRLARVDIARSFGGGDGLLLVDRETLVLVANRTPELVSETAFVLGSKDAWASAVVTASTSLGNVYPTTCATLDGRVYALSSHLDEWLGATDATRDAVAKQARRAEIREIGVVTP
jgi:hypothetical protein